MAIKITRQRRAGSPHTKHPGRRDVKKARPGEYYGPRDDNTQDPRSRGIKRTRKGSPHPTEEDRIRKMMADGRKQLAKLKARGLPKPKPRKPKKPMKRK